jgi:hypothetical protein
MLGIMASHLVCLHVLRTVTEKQRFRKAWNTTEWSIIVNLLDLRFSQQKLWRELSWDGMPWPVEVHQYFWGMYCLHFQGWWEAKQVTSKKQALPGLLFDPEDGGGTFLQNIGEHLPDYYSSISKKTVLFTVSSVIRICIWFCSSQFHLGGR